MTETTKHEHLGEDVRGYVAFRSTDADCDCGMCHTVAKAILAHDDEGTVDATDWRWIAQNALHELTSLLDDLDGECDDCAAHGEPQHDHPAVPTAFSDALDDLDMDPGKEG